MPYLSHPRRPTNKILPAPAHPRAAAGRRGRLVSIGRHGGGGAGGGAAGAGNAREWVGGYVWLFFVVGGVGVVDWVDEEGVAGVERGEVIEIAVDFF